MGTVPVLKPREVAASLIALGFEEKRQRGSHRQYRHLDGRGTTLPFHAGRDISPTLLRKIARDIGITVEELLANRQAAESGSSGPVAGSGVEYRVSRPV
jgi:predicted RNA binding protein YcfA (HicA-like mRNA interferase family)